MESRGEFRSRLGVFLWIRRQPCYCDTGNDIDIASDILYVIQE